jgi:hypothetical protein
VRGRERLEHETRSHKEMSMSPSDLNPHAAWRHVRVFEPRHAPSCRCVDHEVMASRDEDGDWTCCSCGRPLLPSLTGLRAFRPALRDSALDAAQCAGSRR